MSKKLNNLTVNQEVAVLHHNAHTEEREILVLSLLSVKKKKIKPPHEVLLTLFVY